MSEKYKIIGVCARSGKREPEFDGFLLSGIQGSVDPFASGHLERPDFSPADLLEWADQQVGKYLECAGLVKIAVATYGQTKIISE